MNSSEWSKSREEVFLQLLDDDTPSVQRALLAEFKTIGDPAIDFLKVVSEGKDDSLVFHARKLLHQLTNGHLVDEFKAFIKSFKYELETGCLLINRVVQPRLEVADVCIFLDEMAMRCRELIAKPQSIRETCRTINRVMFHEYGFRADVDNFYDPNNSLIASVIERKRGIPITLAIIYLLIADRCGVVLEPVGVPGRFMVGYFRDKEPLYIDPYARGYFRTADEIRGLLRGYNIDPQDSYLAPTTVGEVLCRCCRNMVEQYMHQGEKQKADLFDGLVKEFEMAYREHELS